MNLTVACDTWFHSYTIYSQFHFLKRTWTEKQKTFKMIVLFLQKSCLSSERQVFLSFLSPFCLLLLPSYTKKKAFIKLVQHKKWIFSQGSWILKNIGCCFETHTPTWQHSMESQCFVWVWYTYTDPCYSSAHGSQESWFKPTSEHSELRSTALCAGIAGPQLSVAINSHSPTGSTAASKILLSRWVSETVVVITLLLFACFCRSQVICLGSVPLPVRAHTISREKSLPPQGSSILLFSPGCWETTQAFQAQYRGPV